MRQTVYALRFRGEASWAGTDGNLLRIVARAAGSAMRSRFDRDGLHGDVQDEPGDEIRLESELTITGATTFQEIGSIVFGANGDRLRFSTRGSGHLDPAVVGTGRRGAAVLQVDDGERRFALTHGLLTATYDIDATGAVSIMQLGSIVFWDGGSLAMVDSPASQVP